MTVMIKITNKLTFSTELCQLGNHKVNVISFPNSPLLIGESIGHEVKPSKKLNNLCEHVLEAFKYKEKQKPYILRSKPYKFFDSFWPRKKKDTAYRLQ